MRESRSAMSTAADGTTTSVLHVIDRLTTTGGAETSLRQSLPHLGRCGISSQVLTLLPHVGESAVEDVERGGTPVVRVEAEPRRTTVPAVRRIVRTARPDVVHASVHEAATVTRLAALRSRVPVVVSLINTPYTGEARTAYGSAWKVLPHLWLDRLLSRRATTAFHAISRTTAEHAVEVLGVPWERITIIPRGRDRAALGEPGPERRSRARRALGIATDTPVVVTVGRQERQKAQHELLHAFAEVERQVPDARLLVAGRAGANTGRLLEQVEALGLQRSVVFLGARRDVPDVLCAADVFAFTSRFEGLGGAVLEAMALEVPVVSYSCPAVEEALGGCGRVVPFGRRDLLAAHLVEALEQPRAAAVRAVQARHRFDAHYDMGAVAAQMAAWYTEVSLGARH